MNKDSLDIKNLQFYWRLKSSPKEKNIVLNFMPFKLGFDAKIGLLTQRANKKVLSSLSKIYKKEWNIGNIQDINDWGHLYTKDFVSFINLSISSSSKKIKRILEIGCGACVLLETLKKKGYQVMGIDPSVLSKKEGKRKGIEVIVDFYPSKKIKGKFDLIVHSDVLEHITDPITFLKLNLEQLNDGGMIILTVPDCTEQISYGDISMVYHQHVNYFDQKSLRATLKTAGFTRVHVEKAAFGGSLNCVALKSNGNHKAVLTNNKLKFQTFLRKNKKLATKFKDYVYSIIKEKNRSLGFYAPLRILPYLPMLNLYKGVRFFDDTSRWHLKYFDGINIMVENFEDLKKTPVTDLIIMSPTFGDIIKRKITDHFNRKIRIKTIKDFYK